jgi:hypothetical protein
VNENGVLTNAPSELGGAYSLGLVLLNAGISVAARLLPLLAPYVSTWAAPELELRVGEGILLVLFLR